MEIIQVLIFLAVILFVIFKSYQTVSRRKNLKIDNFATPILLTHFSDNAALDLVKEGTIEGLHYSIFISLSGSAPQQLENSNSAVYRVELPFFSDVHLLAITKNEGATQIRPRLSSIAIEPVELEGDFNNFFTLYADKNMQSLSRYVLDPKAMLYILDFCRSHSWEIVNNELYFVEEFSTDKAGDETSAFKDINNFVNEIRPAIEKKLTAKQLQVISPYGQDRRQDLKCPICKQLMQNHRSYFSCSVFHGFLVTAKTLNDINKDKVVLEQLDSINYPKRAEQLTCPSCNSLMTSVDYNSSGVVIDSCTNTNCNYRWLDAGEARKISNRP